MIRARATFAASLLACLSALGPPAALAAEGQLVDQLQTRLDAREEFRRIEVRRLTRPGTAYPLRRTEERLRYDASTGKIRSLGLREYVADHVLVRFNRPLTAELEQSVRAGCAGLELRWTQVEMAGHWHKAHLPSPLIEVQDRALSCIGANPAALLAELDGIVRAQ